MTKILIVDDDQFSIDILFQYFEDLLPKYILESTLSANVAIQKYKDFAPDIVLLDVVLPDINGYELCKKIRACELINKPKIILQSGLAMIEDIRKGYESGADHYISKPYYIEDLLKLIEN